MEPVTISQIEERLEKLSPERLRVVYDFVSYLVERENGTAEILASSDALQTMLASEAVLRRDWDTPEEDAAWAHL
ncbi:MAG TPA: hypothetical protein VGD69_02070 [Herpetosiphonaceae bacterium]